LSEWLDTKAEGAHTLPILIPAKLSQAGVSVASHGIFAKILGSFTRAKWFFNL
jgi:hypothetical protein